MLVNKVKHKLISINFKVGILYVFHIHKVCKLPLRGMHCSANIAISAALGDVRLSDPTRL